MKKIIPSKMKSGKVYPEEKLDSGLGRRNARVDSVPYKNRNDNNNSNKNDELKASAALFLTELAQQLTSNTSSSKFVLQTFSSQMLRNGSFYRARLAGLKDEEIDSILRKNSVLSVCLPPISAHDYSYLHNENQNPKYQEKVRTHVNELSGYVRNLDLEKIMFLDKAKQTQVLTWWIDYQLGIVNTRSSQIDALLSSIGNDLENIDDNQIIEPNLYTV